MRLVLVALSALALVAPLAIATPIPVNPVLNSGFEHALPNPGVLPDRSFGVGRQVLGCGALADAIWTSPCGGPDRDAATAVLALAADPESEVAYWTAPGYHEGDLAVVNPAQNMIWHAVNWNAYPPGSIAFGDAGGDGDREARILAGNQMLYQTFGPVATHSLVPAGLVAATTFSLEAGATGGYFSFVLDSFPVESVADYPQAFHNYQIIVPAAAWTATGGVVSIDPTTGYLIGPYAGSYVLPRVPVVGAPVPPEVADIVNPVGALVNGADPHPTAAQWSSASSEERREMLMEFRIVQFTFWNLPAGAVVDDVAFALDA